MSLPQIRACTADDAAALSLVAKATFLETFSGVLDGKAIISQCENVHSSASYASQLENSTYRFWLAAVDPGGAPVGFAMVSNPDLPVPITAHDIELKRIYLLSKFQGGGTGKRLLAEAIHYARSSGANRLLLGVYAGNVRAKISIWHRGSSRSAAELSTWAALAMTITFSRCHSTPNHSFKPTLLHGRTLGGNGLPHLRPCSSAA